MFHWRKKTDRLDIPAETIRHLLRSLSDIQVALPGLPSQQATAYLCLYAARNGCGISIVLHLHASRYLAFYSPEREIIPEGEVEKVLDEGIHFAESMGFIMGDLDIHLLDPAERKALWSTLPLKSGIPAEPLPSELPQVESRKEKAPAGTGEGPRIEGSGEGDRAGTPETAGAGKKAEEAENAGEIENAEIGELESNLEIRRAAVMRRRRPSPEEMETRKKTFLENLGRFLASF